MYAYHSIILNKTMILKLFFKHDLLIWELNWLVIYRRSTSRHPCQWSLQVLPESKIWQAQRELCYERGRAVSGVSSPVRITLEWTAMQLSLNQIYITYTYIYNMTGCLSTYFIFTLMYYFTNLHIIIITDEVEEIKES